MNSAAHRTMAFAVLHVADFSLQAFLRTAPDLTAQPVALLDGERKRAAVVAMTPVARAQGVELGLTAPQALARCPRLLLRPPLASAEADAAATLLASAFTLSPVVEATALGVATVDMTALPPDQREPRLRAALLQLDALGLVATAGLAASPLLALYAARAAWHGLPAHDLKREKENENEHEKGKRCLVVTDPRSFLEPLPLAVADPPPDLAPILSAWGLRTLGDLIALPKADIVQRLGPVGLALWERAAGETGRPLRSVAPSRRFEAALDLEHPVQTLEPLLFLLRRFIDRLALELQTAGLVAAELRLELPLEDDTAHTRSFRLPEPTARADLLFRTLHSHLETVQTEAAIAAVRLSIDPTRPLARQHGLFDTGLRDPHGFAETLARAGAIAGSDRVGTPGCDDTHRPDALTLAAPAAVVPPPGPPAPLPPAGLPLRRFRPPLPANVEMCGPSSTPAYLWTDALHGAINEARGPWQGSGDWWQRDAHWQREEWDVALAEGGLYRITRTPEGWWLEGEYD